jgi:hypothetical protein
VTKHLLIGTDRRKGCSQNLAVKAVFAEKPTPIKRTVVGFKIELGPPIGLDSRASNLTITIPHIFVSPLFFTFHFLQFCFAIKYPAKLQTGIRASKPWNGQ